MISAVFVIGVLNLILGFALAVLLERQITIPVPALRDAQVEPDTVFEVPVRDQQPIDELRDTLPKRWLDLLDRGDIGFSTFVEAATEILRLEVAGYRNDLFDVDDLVHSTTVKGKPEALANTIGVLVALNEEWVNRQKDALEVMSRRQGQLGEYSGIGNSMESILLDQTTLLQQECDDLLRLKEDCTAEGVADAVVRSLERMAAMAHSLRDSIRDSSLLIICEEGRLQQTDRGMHVDDVTGLQNRVALELIFENWWREDTDRSRQLSAALIDVDHCGELNSQLTTRVGDRVLKNLAIYLEKLCDSESGMERVYHYAGQKFFVFLGDTGPRAAAGRIEKVRQTVEATTFEYQGKSFSLTVRAGVAGARPDDDTRSLFARLEELAETARHAGRNRTALEDGSGAGVVQPETMEVKGRKIKVE